MENKTIAHQLPFHFKLENTWWYSMVEGNVITGNKSADNRLYVLALGIKTGEKHNFIWRSTPTKLYILIWQHDKLFACCVITHKQITWWPYLGKNIAIITQALIDIWPPLLDSWTGMFWSTGQIISFYTCWSVFTHTHTHTGVHSKTSWTFTLYWNHFLKI